MLEALISKDPPINVFDPHLVIIDTLVAIKRIRILVKVIKLNKLN